MKPRRKFAKILQHERSIREHETTVVSQAERIIRKFGNPRDLARALEAVGHSINPSSVYRWVYDKSTPSGTGGTIPTRLWPKIIEAARYAGILLTDEDFNPKPQIEKQQTILAEKGPDGHFYRFVTTKERREKQAAAAKLERAKARLLK